MGMSIEEAIEFGNMWIDMNQDAKETNTFQFFSLAIATMQKYQKIQEIVRWNNAPSPYYKPDGQLFREICEVLEGATNGTVQSNY